MCRNMETAIAPSSHRLLQGGRTLETYGFRLNAKEELQKNTPEVPNLEYHIEDLRQQLEEMYMTIATVITYKRL